MINGSADVSCRLLEVDFSGIEAVLTGWFQRDPEYIRLAKLGVHAGLASVVLGKPYNPADSDEALRAYFKSIKGSEKLLYDRCKRTVHGSNYGLTEYGMARNFHEVFPTLAIAKKFKRLYAEMCPALVAWQRQTQERAYQQNFLGGPGDHPFGYKHWFWAVLGFRAIPEHVYLKRQKAHEPVTRIQGRPYAIILGEDAKRAVAFYPQSTAAGVLKEALLRLFEPDSPSYIGDAYFGRTPLRAPIHDSGLFEIPNRCWDRVLERIVAEMTKAVPELPLDWVPAETRTRLGFGSHLQIGVEAKAGKDWEAMEVIALPEQVESLTADDTKFEIDGTAEGEEEWDSLRTVWSAAAGAA